MRQLIRINKPLSPDLPAGNARWPVTKCLQSGCHGGKVFKEKELLYFSKICTTCRQVCFDSKERFLWLTIIQHGGLPHNHA